jgi:hypothetical protein
MGGLLFFLRSGIKPLGVSDDDFQLFAPVCEALVGKGQLEPKIMDAFKKDS